MPLPVIDSRHYRRTVTDPWEGIADLVALVAPRLLNLEGNDEPGAAHSRDCEYEWLLQVEEWGVRLAGLLTALHDSPPRAYFDASTLRDDVLAAGFDEIHRCEISAVRVEDMRSHATVGWRGCIYLGLRRRVAL